MKVLIVGGGGREHALAWHCAQTPEVSAVYVAPGNAGTEAEAKVTNVGIDAGDIDQLVRFAGSSAIDLTIIGPEAPLVAGITDAFNAAGLPCFGPSRRAAALEGSKAFAKAFLTRHGIPTAAYQTFTSVAEATAYLEKQTYPVVIKADGLAAGKGVVIAADPATARQAVNTMLAEHRFGDAGRRVVIEEFLTGEEASFIVVADGRHVLPLATSQDHKARFEGDTGPNTGGMGACSPAPVVTPAVHERIMNTVILPAVEGMAREGMPYVGFLYAGLMIDPEGNPKVLEFNCRFGDPETQPVLMRLQTPLVDICRAALAGQLPDCTVRWDPRPALGVVLTAEGYPGDYRKGDIITGLPEQALPDAKVFHAGTARHNGDIVTAGGRVLCVVGRGDSLTAAKERAYRLVEQIHWPGMGYRRDIGDRAIARENTASSQAR